MSNATANSDELKTLKQEAAELQERRQQNDQIASESAEQQEQSDPGEKMDQEVSPTPEADQPDNGVPDLVQQLEMYINEIEETALERPALALLTTFALGVIVGHLFTQKWEE